MTPTSSSSSCTHSLISLSTSAHRGDKIVYIERDCKRMCVHRERKIKRKNNCQQTAGRRCVQKSWKLHSGEGCFEDKQECTTYPTWTVDINRFLTPRHPIATCYPDKQELGTHVAALLLVCTGIGFSLFCYFYAVFKVWIMLVVCSPFSCHNEDRKCERWHVGGVCARFHLWRGLDDYGMFCMRKLFASVKTSGEKNLTLSLGGIHRSRHVHGMCTRSLVMRNLSAYFQI